MNVLILMEILIIIYEGNSSKYIPFFKLKHINFVGKEVDVFLYLFLIRGILRCRSGSGKLGR